MYSKWTMKLIWRDRTNIGVVCVEGQSKHTLQGGDNSVLSQWVDNPCGEIDTVGPSSVIRPLQIVISRIPR